MKLKFENMHNSLKIQKNVQFLENFTDSTMVSMKSLFRNEGFILDEIPWQNASKFAIFYIYESPKLLFWFFIWRDFIFPLMNALIYVDIDQGIHSYQ